jgi:hypothetical protein
MQLAVPGQQQLAERGVPVLVGEVGAVDVFQRCRVLDQSRVGQQHRGLALRRGVVFSRLMQARQGLAGSDGVLMLLKRRPRQRIAIQVQALGDVVYFIGPLTLRSGGGAVLIRDHRSHWSALAMQVSDQAVFFFQPRGLAHMLVMTFDEQRARAGGDQARGGKRPWAVPMQAAQWPQLRVIAQQLFDVAFVQRRPVGGDRFHAQAMGSALWVHAATSGRKALLVAPCQTCGSSSTAWLCSHSA